jgi:hypothetical protein
MATADADGNVPLVAGIMFMCTLPGVGQGGSLDGAIIRLPGVGQGGSLDGAIIRLHGYWLEAMMLLLDCMGTGLKR